MANDLKTCPKCGRLYSSSYARCPHSHRRGVASDGGPPLKTRDGGKAAAALIGILVVGIVAVLYLPSQMPVSNNSARSPRPTIAKSVASPPEVAQAPRSETISGDGYFGCLDRSYYEKIARYAADHDENAWRKALMDGYYSDRCVPFKEGETVFIESTAVLSGLMKIRREGETNEYWTVIEAAR